MPRALALVASSCKKVSPLPILVKNSKEHVLITLPMIVSFMLYLECLRHGNIIYGLESSSCIPIMNQLSILGSKINWIGGMVDGWNLLRLFLMLSSIKRERQCCR